MLSPGKLSERLDEIPKHGGAHVVAETAADIVFRTDQSPGDQTRDVSGLLAPDVSASGRRRSSGRSPRCSP